MAESYSNEISRGILVLVVIAAVGILVLLLFVFVIEVDDDWDCINRIRNVQSVPSNTLCSPSTSNIHDDDDDEEEEGNTSLGMFCNACQAWSVNDAVVRDDDTSVSFPPPTPPRMEFVVVGVLGVILDIEFLCSVMLNGPQEHLVIHRVAPYHISSRS